MRRRLLILAVFLLAGAVVNVAVAWGCARWSDWLEMTLLLTWGASPETSLDGPFPGAWRLKDLPKSWPDKPTYGVTTRSGWFRLVGQIACSDNGGGVALHERAFGLPTKSLAYYELASSRRCWPWLRTRGALANELRYAIGRPGGSFTSIRLSSSRRYPLPLRPIWLSFAINTLFYAAVLWLLIGGPFALRRFIRVRCGRCPKCGYPVGDSAVCSECGMARA